MNGHRDGGYAFPQALTVREEFVGSEGMTLRDYFAGQALIGIAFSMNSDARRKYRDGTADKHEAVAAYAIADAMLYARLLNPAMPQQRDALVEDESNALATSESLS